MAVRRSPITFKTGDEFARVLDRLAERRGLSRSEFIRQLVAEEAFRIASPDRHDERK